MRPGKAGNETKLFTLLARFAKEAAKGEGERQVSEPRYIVTPKEPRTRNKKVPTIDVEKNKVEFLESVLSGEFWLGDPDTSDEEQKEVLADMFGVYDH